MLLLSITGAIGHGKSSLAEAFLKCDETAVHTETSQLISEFANQVKQTIPTKADVTSVNQWLEDIQPKIDIFFGIKSNFGDLKLAPNANFSSPEFSKLQEYIKSSANSSSFRAEIISPDNKEAHRAILQWFGGYFTEKISNTIWADTALTRAVNAKASGCQLYIIGGMRFPSQIETVRQAGGLIIEIQRPGLEEKDVTDPTERERHNIKPDIKIINNGSVNDLQETAKKIFKDVKHNKIKSIYYSSN